ncbi:dynein axonemal heavy chain 7-like [Bolinopsis microptera]|uniref:dynein axonemal heavy chain 7-like n=1 Tax=Bolinopsis microptera TaxID=2820187 RepID=UPI00307A9517
MVVIEHSSQSPVTWVQNSYETLVRTLRELNTRCPLSNRKSAALQSLLLQFLAQRDRLNALRTVEVLSPTSFAVLAVPKFTISPQLGRFDWLSSMLPANINKSSPRIDITVSQLTAEMTYDYEYLGRYSRLVITPITERVQFSLVAAVTLRQTLAITGPSNSGKFETVKDYANMLGRYCVEYSDTLQPLLLSHLLAGLIQTGCWMVVRMFERSDLLSELGQVLQGIHRGFASLADARLFNEQKCPVIPSFHHEERPASHEPSSKINREFQTPSPLRPDTVSAQLNLSSEHSPPVPNYLGNIMVGDTLVPASGSFQCILTLPRSQPLPLNLKDCCRGMSMMLPDLDTIILAKLISAGYKFYDHLSIKLSCFITYLDPMVVNLELYTLPIVKSIPPKPTCFNL